MTPPPPAPPDPEVLSKFLPQRQTLNENHTSLEQETGLNSNSKDGRTSFQKCKTNNLESSPIHGFVVENCNNTDYYERTSSFSKKAESPSISLSPVWIPR